MDSVPNDDDTQRVLCWDSDGAFWIERQPRRVDATIAERRRLWRQAWALLFAPDRTEQHSVEGHDDEADS